MRRTSPTLAALLAVVALAGCGRGDSSSSTSRGAVAPLAKAPKADKDSSAQDIGIPSVATKNTVRVAGADAVTDAAASALAVYPSGTASTRPKAVVLADRSDWRTAVAASVLMARPVRAPILFSDGAKDLPDATSSALSTLRPTGSKDAGGAQIIRVGAAPALARYKSTDVKGSTPAALARALDAFSSAVRGQTSDRVLVVSADAPEYALPAAAWAAKSGDPVLFVSKDTVPADTVAAIKTHQQPKIYVLGPSKVISPKATRTLRKLGSVRRIGGPDPVRNAIGFARYADGSFGWGVTNPGHGFVIARADSDPATAAAVAPLSATGSYGPLLLNTSADRLDPRVSDYLALLRPGYSQDPVRGVYNRAWIVGDDDALSGAVQSSVDELLEIQPVTTQP